MDLSKLKIVLKTALELSKPYVLKVIEEKIIPAAKTFIYTSLQKKKNAAVGSLLKVLTKYKNETDETKKNAHRVGLELGVAALTAIANSLTEATDAIKAELSEC